MRFGFGFALFTGKLIMGLTKILPGVSGTTWPGGIANMIKKNFITYFDFNPETRIVMVTGTSGKTTTTGMLAQLIKSEGKKVCTNDIGANMERGVATSLIKSAKLSGKVDVDYVILEVDERYLPIVSQKIKPDVILVTNVLKDQSQRNGEPGVIMGKISSAIENAGENVHLILNRDEPNTTSLGYKHKKVSYYGVQGEADEKRENTFTVACSCPVCGSAITYDYENLYNIGKFSCTKCDLKSEEGEKATVIDILDEKTITVGDKKFTAKYLSKDFMYCYSSMLAFAKHEGISDKGIQKSMDSFKIQSGRVEDMKAGGKTIHYLRIKQETPVTLQSAINVTTADKNEKIVVLDLSEVVDFQPHYTGMYYAYDCDFGRFLNNNVVKYICMSKTICYDVATRLSLEGVKAEDIKVIPTDNYDELLRELENYDCKDVYLLTWMHSYFSCVSSVEKYKKEKGE